MSPEKEEPEIEPEQLPLPTMLPHREKEASEVEPKPVKANLNEEVLTRLADELQKELEESSSNTSESDDSQ